VQEWLTSLSRDDGPRPEVFWENTHHTACRTAVRRDGPLSAERSAMVVEFPRPTRDERPDVEDLARSSLMLLSSTSGRYLHRVDVEITVRNPDDTFTADVESVLDPDHSSSLGRRATDSRRWLTPETLLASIFQSSRAVPMEPRDPDGSVRLSARLASPDGRRYVPEQRRSSGAGMVVNTTTGKSCHIR